jgi:hypothetical protein
MYDFKRIKTWKGTLEGLRQQALRDRRNRQEALHFEEHIGLRQGRSKKQAAEKLCRYPPRLALRKRLMKATVFCGATRNLAVDLLYDAGDSPLNSSGVILQVPGGSIYVI